MNMKCLWLILVVAVLMGCGTAAVTSRNASGNASTYSGSGLSATFAEPLVNAEAYAMRTKADAETRSLDTDAAGRLLAARANYSREMALAAAVDICNAKLFELAKLNREQRFQCRQARNHIYHLEVLDRWGVWMPMYSFGAGDAYSMMGAAAMVGAIQSGAMPAPGARELGVVNQDVAATRNRQRAVENVVRGLNQDVHRVIGK